MRISVTVRIINQMKTGRAHYDQYSSKTQSSHHHAKHTEGDLLFEIAYLLRKPVQYQCHAVQIARRLSLCFASLLPVQHIGNSDSFLVCGAEVL
jgi:hypothetical protein